MDGVDSITARLQTTTIASRSKMKTPRGALPSFSEENSEKKKPSFFKSKILSLSQRIGIGSVPRMIPAEEINHESHEGRTLFYDQLCYLLRAKISPSQYQKPV